MIRLRAAVLVVLLAACQAPADPGSQAAADETGGGDRRDDVTGEVVVQAAASLTDAFTEMAALFEQAHPAADVTLNLAGSQSLATQILQGAPADVFASADRAQMKVVQEEGLVSGAPRPFTANTLAIAVEDGNPLGIAGLEDLADPGLVLVLAAPDVPAGAFAIEVLDAAGVTVTPASLEVDVRAVLAKVRLGEADAGIVYASDLVAAGEAVGAVDIPPAQNVVATYPIAVLADAPNPDGAAAFVELVTSPTGLRVLERHGFISP